MSIFHRVTLAFLKQNRRRTLVTIIGIALSTTMICAVAALVLSMQNYLLDYSVYGSGDYYAYARGVTGEELTEFLTSEELTEVACARETGYALLEGGQNEDKPYLQLLTVEEGFYEQMSVIVTEGRLPESETEVLVPAHVASNGGVSYEIGDTLTLSLGYRLSEDGELLLQADEYEEGETLVTETTVTLTVVGFYMRPGFEDISAPGYTLLTTGEVLVAQSEGSVLLYDVYYKIQNVSQIYTFYENHPFETQDRGTNRAELIYIGVSVSAGYNALLYGMAGILIFIIVVGSVALIYNSFAISVRERTSQFGLLASLGATRRQLRSCVFQEALYVSLIGIPLGIVCGHAGIGITLMATRGLMAQITGISEIHMKLILSAPAIGVAALIATVTVGVSAWIPARRAQSVSPIEAIRQTRDIYLAKRDVKISPLLSRLLGVEGLIAAKNFQRSKKRYRTTVVSLVISVVLFVTTTSYCDYLMEAVDAAYETDRYDIVYYADELLSQEELEAKKELFLSLSGVSEATYIRTLYLAVMISLEDYDGDYLSYLEGNGYGLEQWEELGYLTQSIGLVFIEDETYLSYLREQGLSEELYYDAEKPLGLCYARAKFYDNEQGRYVNMSLLRSRSTTLSLYYADMDGEVYWDFDYNEEGDIVLYCYSGQEAEVLGETREVTEAFTQVLAVGQLVETTPYCISSAGHQMVVFYPMSFFETIIGNAEEYSQSCSLYLICDNHASTALALSSLGLSGRYVDQTEENEHSQMIIQLFQIFVYGFITLISLISVANVFNTITTNLQLRRREFAVLRSIGLTGRGYRRMLYYECFFYGSRALLFSIPLALFFSYLIYSITDEAIQTSWQPPFSSLAIAISLVFALVFVTMLYGSKKLQKQNLVEELRNETV